MWLCVEISLNVLLTCSVLLRICQVKFDNIYQNKLRIYIYWSFIGGILTRSFFLTSELYLNET
jgi:uncharacterized membrane protein YdcZ (DUF606 family)